MTIWRVLQLIGASCLLVVLLTHVAEALKLFPGMGWGLPTSPGHYLDLISAVLGCALLPLGFLGNAIARRKKTEAIGRVLINRDCPQKAGELPGAAQQRLVETEKEFRYL